MANLKARKPGGTMERIAEDLEPLAVPLGSLSELPGNPRRGDVAAVARSYERFGQRKPIVARRQPDGSGVVIAGNHQFAAARSLGWERIAVVWVDDDDETAAAYALADNRTAELGGYDDAALLALIQSVEDEDLLRSTGWDDAAAAELLSSLQPPPVVEEDEVPGVADVETRSALGDLWQVGPHRIICGDSTDADVYQRLMGDVRADFVFTDPPYGVDVQERDMTQASVRGRRKDGKGVLNDNLNAESLATLLNDAFALAVAQCKKGAAWYVCSPPGDLMTVFGAALNVHGIGKHSLVWVKNALVMGRSDYHYRHEVIFYGWVPGAAHNWYADRKQDSVWEFDRPSRSPEHPTMKPVELVAYAMGNSSKPGDIVLDPFCGSGTTLVAAAQTGRVGYGIELSPEYVDVIISRLEKQTGVEAERLS